MVVFGPRRARSVLAAWVSFSIVVCGWVGWLVTRG